MIEKELQVIDVFEDNFFQEISDIGSLLKSYTYVAMDTEYPGVPYVPNGDSGDDFCYKLVKQNVDQLKCI